MTSATEISPGTRQPAISPRRAAAVLEWTARAWFSVAATGQLLFACYVAALYGGGIVQGNLARWNTVAPHAYVPGATANNIAFGAHVIIAIVITIGGTLQLMPFVRRAAPAFHRVNGRVYVVLSVLTSIGGLFMVWGRGTVGDLSQHLGISLNAVLIMLCAALAVHHARAGRIAVHRRWAMRLFLVVSGVWFFRVGLMFWIVVNQGPAGFDQNTFTGPTLTILSFAQSLLPLAILELYLRARDGGSVALRLSSATSLAASTVVTGAGIVAAAMILWLPRI